MKSYRLPLTLMVFAIMGLMVMSCNNESANSASTDTTEEAGAVAASDNTCANTCCRVCSSCRSNHHLLSFPKRSMTME